MIRKAIWPVYVRRIGRQLTYEIEVRPERQQYLIRRDGEILKDGGVGAGPRLQAETLYMIACDDIENLIGMSE